MKKQVEEKETIAYDLVIAALLLKFDKLDNVDISLIIEDFEKKTNFVVDNMWSNPLDFLKKEFIVLEDGTTKLKDVMSLTDFERYKSSIVSTIQNWFEDDDVDNYFKVFNDYFNNFDVNKYKLEKEKLLVNNKKNVLEKANVLLISDIQKDYDELIKYGFKNVDYFKSIVRADKYFAEHPEELQKYHIILKGNQNVQKCCFHGDVALDGKISILSRDTDLLGVEISRYNLDDHYEFVGILSDVHNWRMWHISEFTYCGLFDRIVENSLINHTLDKVGLNNKEFIPIKDYVNPNRLPLPTKKADMKILYLDSVQVSKYANAVAKHLGLDITFKEDSNNTLGEYVKTHLGDYDIIIASDLYSRNLVKMNVESTEQSKDTGRDLTLLVSYEEGALLFFDEDGISDNNGLGSKISLNYSYGGISPFDLEYHNKEFRVLRKTFDFISEKDRGYYYENDVACMMGIIGASLNIYNDALLQMNKPSISDIDIKTAEEFDIEYEIVEIREKERIADALAPIKGFDELRNNVSSYLYYKKKGLISQIPKGLIITEVKNGIKIDNIKQGRTVCTITIPEGYTHNTLRVLKIQTLLKDGNLSNPETIGLYTKKYENLENIPKRPSKRQADALLELEKKINYKLLSLNADAWDRECKLEKSKRLKLERK